MDHAEGIDREVSSSQSANSNQSDIPSGFKHGGVEDAGRPDADEAAQPADFPAASRPPTGPTNGLSQVRSDTASLFSHWAEDQPPQTHGPAAVDPALGHPSPQAQPDARHFHDVAEPSRHDVADPQPDVATPMGTGFHPRLRAEMEHRFGEDFSGVSVQRGLSPEDQSAGVRAVAEREHVTADSNILDNQLHPENKQILAEELAHVVQKRRGSVVRDAVDEHGPERGAQMAPPHRGELEDEAQTAAARAVAGENVTVGSGARAPARQFSLWSWAKDKAKGAADWVGDKASKAGNWVGDKVESGGDWLAKKIDKGADWIEDKASKGASWVGDKLGKGASWVGDKLGKGASWVGDKLGKGASWVGDKLGKGMDWLGNSWLGKGASWVGDKLGKGASWVGDKLGKGASWVGDKLGKGMDWLGNSWLGKGASWVGDKLGKGASWVGDKLGKGASWVGDKLGKGASWVGDKLGKGASWVGDKLGKGMDWLGNSWLGKGASWVGDKLGKGASWVGDKIDGGESWLRDKVSKGTDWLSHTWVGKIARGVGKVGSAIARPVGRWLGKGLGLLEKGANYLSSGINKGVSAIGRGVDWFEDKVGSAADWVAKKTAGIPVLGTMTQMGASFVKFQSQVVGGFVKGGVDMIGGLANMALHPVDTATGLFHLAEHLPMVPGIPNPFKLAHNLYDVAAGNKRLSEALNDTFNPWKSMKDDGKFLTQFGKAFLEPYIQAVKDGKPGEAVGRLGFDVLMLIGTDGAGALGRGTGEALNTAGKLEQGTKVLSELEKAEQGTKVLSEAEKAEQGLKTLSKEAEPELSKAKDGPKALSDGEKAEPAATKTGEQPKPRLTSEEYPGRREPSPQASKPAPQIHSAEWEQGAKKAREDVKRGHKDPDGIWDQNVLKSEKGQDLKTKLDAFDEGKVGKSVKDFKTAGKSPEQIHRELLEQGFEHKREPLSAGKDPKTKEPLYKKRDGTTTTNPSDPDVVPHDIYVNPKDGGMVRVKPEGDPVVPGKDAYRPEPHVSKSVVYDPAKGTGFENEAFKVTDGGDAVPKTMSKDAGMKQAPKGSKSVEENRGYKDAVMQDAHTDLPEQEPSLIEPPTTEMQGGSK